MEMVVVDAVRSDEGGDEWVVDFDAASFMAPERMERQVLAVEAPERVLMLARTVSMCGVVASPMLTAPRAGRMWFLIARR